MFLLRIQALSEKSITVVLLGYLMHPPSPQQCAFILVLINEEDTYRNGCPEQVQPIVILFLSPAGYFADIAYPEERLATICDVNDIGRSFTTTKNLQYSAFIAYHWESSGISDRGAGFSIGVSKAGELVHTTIIWYL